MFYTNNRFNNMAEIDVEPNMAYAHENGALVAMIEGYENARALFEATIYTDVQEAALIREGASEEELVSLHENAITSFFAKIKEFFKKLWEKIKAVFYGFVARFNAFFMKGDKLVKKYRAELMKKNLKGVNFSFDLPEASNWADAIPEPSTSVAINISSSADLSKVDDYDNDKQICEYLDDLTNGKVKCSDPSDFDGDFHDACFKGVDEVDGETLKMPLLNFLANKEALKNIEKISKALNKAMNNINKSIDDDEKKINSAIGKKNNSFGYTTYTVNIGKTAGTAGKTVAAGDREFSGQNTDNNGKIYGTTSAGKHMSLLRKHAGALQTAITKYTSTSLKEMKNLISRSKSTLARMVAAKEEATLLDAIEDSVFYETELELSYPEIVMD